jgi:rSAM/selenodomain-associated transferase 1
MRGPEFTCTSDPGLTPVTSSSKPRTPTTVIVFARKPRAGYVKRRLARSVGGNRAARIYAKLLTRTLREVEREPGFQRVLMAADKKDLPWFRRHYGARGWLIGAQCCGDLGERMAAALGRTGKPHSNVLLIGSDIIDFVGRDLRLAAASLAHHEAVIGPAADGGFWLIGMTQPTQLSFKQVQWGGTQVYVQMLSNLERDQLRVATINQRHDLDRARDWRWLVSQCRRARF